MDERLEDAHHEAAHVVVGLALGLRVQEVKLGLKNKEGGYYEVGYTQFFGNSSHYAWAIAYAAGIAYEQYTGNPNAHDHGSGDLSALRNIGVRTKGAVAALVVAANGILRANRALHSKVTKALLDKGTLKEADILSLVNEGKIEEDE